MTGNPPMRRWLVETTGRMAKVSCGCPLASVPNLDRYACSRMDSCVVIDAGLGATGPEAFDIRIHAFPGSQNAASAWPESHVAAPRPLPPGIAALVAQGRLDHCGAMTIAGASVGVPCTAMVAAALQVAQACRALETGICADRIDMSLADLGRAAWRRAYLSIMKL